MKSKFSEKEPFQNSEKVQNFKTLDMRVNEKYAYMPSIFDTD